MNLRDPSGLTPVANGGGAALRSEVDIECASTSYQPAPEGHDIEVGDCGTSSLTVFSDGTPGVATIVIGLDAISGRILGVTITVEGNNLSTGQAFKDHERFGVRFRSSVSGTVRLQTGRGAIVLGVSGFVLTTEGVCRIRNLTAGAFIL